MTTKKKQEKKLDVHVRWMIKRDMPGVMAIEKESFSEPWTEDDFSRILSARNCIGATAETHINDEDKVVGYLIYTLWSQTTLEVARFAAHPYYRRVGVGEKLIKYIKSKLSAHKRTTITLKVDETNLGTQLFLKQQGFFATDIVRGYFEDPLEREGMNKDAYVMEYELPTEPKIY